MRGAHPSPAERRFRFAHYSWPTVDATDGTGYRFDMRSLLAVSAFAALSFSLQQRRRAQLETITIAARRHLASNAMHTADRTRSAHAKEAFRRSNPCPATGKTYGACPGYVVDRVQALKRGGAADPSNMQC